MIENNKYSPLDKLRKKIIITGIIGVYLFATSIIGAVLSRYFASDPNYANISKTVFMFSLIDFVFAVGILLVFRNFIISYKAQKDKIDEVSDRI